ncbi:hypothetical protein [Rhizobium binae]|uniref:hypothetical protein n=1 Tax=Rhizobium binae TaxID=1138190 RepID=UPI001C8327C5|nr:hypothetical protein [Rhizobium binae]MBX4941149.1 hypothetical protein [Rhizobium binae]
MEYMEARMQDRCDAFDKEMQAALEADGEKLRALTGEDHGPWPVITDESPCPRCDEVGLWRESADVGVGIIYGPYGCPSCGWSENEEYDLQKGGGVQPDGSYLDPYGMLPPSGNPIAKMLAREAKS